MKINRHAGFAWCLGMASAVSLVLVERASAQSFVNRSRPTTASQPSQYSTQPPSRYFPTAKRPVGRAPYRAPAATSPRMDPNLQQVGYRTAPGTEQPTAPASVPTRDYSSPMNATPAQTYPAEAAYEVAYDDALAPGAAVEVQTPPPVAQTTPLPQPPPVQLQPRMQMPATAPPRPVAPATYRAAQNAYPAETVYEGDSSSQPCAECVTSAPSICDYNGYNKGCDRPTCPCPSDEALSYYRCNFWGHYPTFWRSWPDGFQKYRPQLAAANVHDRFRRSEPGRGMQPGGSGADADLDKQLRELMREQQQTAPPAPRPEPELLPDNRPTVPPPTQPLPPPPTPPSVPAPKDQSEYRQGVRVPAQPAAARTVGYWNNGRQ